MSNSIGQQKESAQDLGATGGIQPRPQALRRRLLLGAAALPSVYTLSSGAAIAAASVNCWAKQSQTANPPAVTAGPDQWYRLPMKSGTDGQSSSVMAYCMNDPAKQAQCTDPLQTSWNAAGTYWYVGGSRTLEAKGGIRNIPKTPGYGLVYVDQTGTIQVFDKNSSSYWGVDLRYASTSCMASISTSTKAMLG